MAEQKFSYRGQGFSQQREKKRFVLPANFRKIVKESSGDKPILCLMKHERWNCLTGFGLSRADDFEAEIDREEQRAIQAGKSFDRELRELLLNGGFSELPFDGSGRFVMPEHLASIVSIGTQAYFQGAGPSFTIWAPGELAKMGEGWEGPKAHCANFIRTAASGSGE